MNLFVSNIDYTITEDDLMNLFSQYGTVESVKILIDLETKKSKGYGFVLMADTDSGITAIQNLDKMKLNGRPMSVQVARPKPEPGSDKPRQKEFNTKPRQQGYGNKPRYQSNDRDGGYKPRYQSNDRDGGYKPRYQSNDRDGGYKPRYDKEDDSQKFSKSGRKLRPRKPRDEGED